MSRLRPSSPLRRFAAEPHCVSGSLALRLTRVVLSPPVRGLPPSAQQRLERPRILSATRSLPALRRQEMASAFGRVEVFW
jgi:hypothetical protein